MSATPTAAGREPIGVRAGRSVRHPLAWEATGHAEDGLSEVA